ncbi:hypothetical protein N431DRAFT_476151 [Stipitochalara longipes BDJ]|nr:hypothetical protein N431DRAFT_476151 [Stipitochalara longipes BDJ]
MSSETSTHPNIYHNPIKVPRPGPTFSNPQELVTFHIGAGTEKQTFLVHKEVATLYSPVLYAAFNSNFLESQTQSYTMDDIEGGVFQLMVQWLYAQKIEYCLTQAEADSLRATPSHTEEERTIVYGKIERMQRLLVRLWVLADRLAIPRLQNLVVDELDCIQRDWNDSVAWHCLNYVYENTVGSSTLRHLILAHCVRFVPAEMMLVHEDDIEIPQTFLQEFLVSSGKSVDLSDRKVFCMHFHIAIEDENEDEGNADEFPSFRGRR